MPPLSQRGAMTRTGDQGPPSAGGRRPRRRYTEGGEKNKLTRRPRRARGPRGWTPCAGSVVGGGGGCNCAWEGGFVGAVGARESSCAAAERGGERKEREDERGPLRERASARPPPISFGDARPPMQRARASGDRRPRPCVRGPRWSPAGRIRRGGARCRKQNQKRRIGMQKKDSPPLRRPRGATWPP